MLEMRVVDECTYSLIFWSRKVFEGVHITCETCLEKASLVHFFLSEIQGHVSKGKFGPLSDCSKRQVWSRFGEKSGPNLPFLNNLNHVREMFSKGKFGPNFSPNLDQTCLFEQSESGPNLPFDT